VRKVANFLFIIAVAILAVATQQTYFFESEPVPLKPLSTVEAKVISVDPPSPQGVDKSGPRQATVKLSTGEIVQAGVGACLIFPGQVTRIAKFGFGSKTWYTVWENGRDDS
jgi:hypothetical protein